MSDDASALPWTPQQWAMLRGVVQEAARKSRVASTFLPIAGPVPADETTVPANWISVRDLGEDQGPGDGEQRLVTKSGKTLHLTTIACNLYLRGSEVRDPNLEAVKSMVRRAAEVLGRVEDAIIFNGLSKEPGSYPRDTRGDAVVKPVIYTISGGRDLTGLREAPDTLLAKVIKTNPANLVTAVTSGGDKKKELEKLDDVMCVTVGEADKDKAVIPIVSAVIRAVEKLERRGHFGPFAAVFGHELFSEATGPAGSAAVLPTERFVPFLAGGEVYRSSALPPGEGVVVALGGEPIELVLGADMDLKFLQVTPEPRYILRVYERFVLRIKELDAVCRVTKTGPCVKEGFSPHKAETSED